MGDPVLIESIEKLHRLIDQARVRGEPESNAATPATADAATGRPSARTAHVHVDKDSVAFFVNARTGKGSQLATNPQAALCFSGARSHSR